MMQVSLSMLLDRVRVEEVSLGYVRKESLINIAEYVVTHGFREISKEESIQVNIILAKYHLYKLTVSYRSMNLFNIEKEREKPYQARCSRCGLPISSKKSLETGLGVVCRKKLGVKA
jgi:formylmethanofuran dehydrogenase subunit E